MTLVPETTVVGAAGALGSLGRTAPVPDVDAAELPTAFVAST